MKQIDALWPESPQKITEKQRRRQERLYPLLTCLGVFAYLLLCAWGGGLL